jgi:uncharacterized protein (UPF0264 family)
MVPSRDLYTSGALPMQPSSPPSEYFSGLVQLINFPQYRQFASLNVKYALFSATLTLHGDILHRPVAADQGKIGAAAVARRDFPRVGLY